MGIRIRPHHLLCMLTFAGKGYSPEFVANFERIAQLIAIGDQTVEIIFAPDDICAPLLAESACHCHNSSIRSRDHDAAEALTNLVQQPVQPGSQVQLSPDILNRMREAFRAGTIRKACQGCQWSPFCDEIAEGNFAGTRLLEFARAKR